MASHILFDGLSGGIIVVSFDGTCVSSLLFEGDVGVNKIWLWLFWLLKAVKFDVYEVFIKGVLLLLLLLRLYGWEKLEGLLFVGTGVKGLLGPVGLKFWNFFFKNGLVFRIFSFKKIKKKPTFYP